MRALAIGLLLLSGLVFRLDGQDLDTADVRVSLEAALPIAQRVAAHSFPDLPAYLLYSITPRVLKGDSGGLHWLVRWQQRAFPHRRWLVVRVYMRDGRAIAERLDEARLPTHDSTTQPQ